MLHEVLPGAVYRACVHLASQQQGGQPVSADVADLAALGGILRCGECGTTRPLHAGDIAGYIQYGWPKCCGYTMTWITQRELDEGRG